MERIKGTLYGVSVGPGDPELLTFKAMRIMRRCPVIAAPQTKSGEMLALDIARQAVDLSRKVIVPLHFTMSHDEGERHKAHRAAADILRGYLDEGQDVAMLNLGDVSVYATFGYLQAILEEDGYPTAMVAGVPSFCAVAARLNRPLTGGMDTPLTIAPGSIPLEEILAAPGAKVLMKSGRQLPQVMAALEKADLLEESALVCNCGLPEEQVWDNLKQEQPEGSAGYFATLLVKQGGKEPKA